MLGGSCIVARPSTTASDKVRMNSMANEDPRELLWPALLLEQGTAHAALAVSLDGTITWANAAAAEILGCTANEICGLHVSAVLTPDDMTGDAPEAPRHPESSQWHVRRDGSRFWPSGTTFPLHDEHGNAIGFGHIFRDRSGLGEYLERVCHQLEAAGTSAAHNDEYLAAVAHELRNHMTPLHMTSALLRAASKDPAVIDVASLIEGQVAKMVSVLDRISSHEASAIATTLGHPAPIEVTAGIEEQRFAWPESGTNGTATSRTRRP